MAVEFRAIGPDEFDDLRKALGLVFSFDPRPDDDRFRATLPLHRTRCGFDDGRMVSTSAAFELDMTVPGGKVACGGTTIVSVSPTHRRQGILRQMMRAHLDDVREHEEPIAALWATDSAIYGRFGYGCASICHEIEVDREHVGFHRLAPAPRQVRLIDADEASRLLPPFFDRVRQGIPGFFDRSPEWWKHRRLGDPEHDRDGMSSYRYVVVDDDVHGDAIAGFAQYRAKLKWSENHGAGELAVRELIGTTAESWASLWSFVLNNDLMGKTTADLRPPWDPIFDLLAGTRRVAATRTDSCWVRIMDIPAALSSRSYTAPVDLVLGVVDPMGDITGSYRLSAKGDDVECARVDDEPDVTLDLEDLGACYLGRARFRQLARVGRVTADGPVLTALDAAFGWDPQPWCPEIF
jgi:predicted acetyltransferase